MILSSEFVGDRRSGERIKRELDAERELERDRAFIIEADRRR